VKYHAVATWLTQVEVVAGFQVADLQPHVVWPVQAGVAIWDDVAL
jgi:hypothetical protein